MRVRLMEKSNVVSRNELSFNVIGIIFRLNYFANNSIKT
jgi:hypothetical protein